MFPQNYPYVGEWETVSIGLNKKFIWKASTNNYYITKDLIKNVLRIRGKFDHKGTYGHGLIVGGSYGKMGAVILAAQACLRSGAGLVSVHIPKCGYEILQTSLPEVMISIDSSQEYFSFLPKNLGIYTAIAVGPGIDTKKQTQKALLSLIKSVKNPLIIDADGINILANNKDQLKHLPENSVLTPHPKEFERLVGKTKNDFDRNNLQVAFAKKHKIFLILKTAHTAIACPDGTCYFNSTGNPGMATAGSGDVLTGILCGLLTQGYTPLETSVLGVYLHGLAGDIAANADAEQSLIASDIIEHLGEAFKEIED